MIEILMAVYNGEKYLLPQLESIFNQTDQGFTLTIRDNCSTDRTVPLIQEFLKRHPGRVTLIEGKENWGARGNFAYLAEIAKRDYIMFSDADDVWLPLKIEETRIEMKRLEALYGTNIPLLVFTDLRVVDQELNTIDKSYWHYCQVIPSSIAELNRTLTMCNVCGCTALFNRALLNRMRPIPTQAVMHDWWLALVVSAFGRASFLSKPTILYRLHEDNESRPRKFAGIKGFLREIGTVLSSFPYRVYLKCIKNPPVLLRIDPRYDQAQVFFERFHNELRPEQEQIVRAFTSLKYSLWLQRKKVTFKYRLYPKAFVHCLRELLGG